MSLQLKVKAKTLAAEARIIKKEEGKQKARFRYNLKTERANSVSTAGGWREYNQLREHRVGPVRLESRLTNIARGFIKGLKFSQIEKVVYDEDAYNRDPQFYSPFAPRLISRLARMVARYSDGRDWGSMSSESQFLKRETEKLEPLIREWMKE